MLRHLFISFLFLMVCPPILQARIIHVPGDSTTIQGGIHGAVDGDTVMIAPGTYREHAIDFLGKVIRVTGTNPSDSAVVASTIVDGDSSGSVFTFHSGEGVGSVLTGMTITGGHSDAGGGVYCYWYSSPTISDNIITANSATFSGGGIFCWYSSPMILNNSITGNLSDTNGGGIFCRSNSEPEISNNAISGNSAGDSGGGIYCMDSSPTLWYNEIADNSAAVSGGGITCFDGSAPYMFGNRILRNQASGSEWTYGGGIYSSYAAPAILRNIISENAAVHGGGIYCAEFSSLISHNLVTDNAASGSGGGIRCGNSSHATISYNSIARNTAANYGGGIYCFAWSDPTIENNTLTGNSAGNYGGGLVCAWSCNPTIVNTILWANDAPTGKEIYVGDETYPSHPDIRYSDVDGGHSSVFVDTSCSIGWGDGMINSDPLLHDSGNDNFRLMAIACGDTADSPCIDAGDPSIEDYLLDCDQGLGTSRSDMGTFGGRWGEPPVSIGDDGGDHRANPLPKVVTLSQNYPNPFNPSTTIAFDIPDNGGREIPGVAGTSVSGSRPERQGVTLAVYDIRGRHVKTLIDSDLEPGSNRVTWNGRSDEGSAVSSGIYLYSLRCGGQTITRKMIVRK